MRRTFAFLLALALIVFVLSPAPGAAASRQVTARTPMTGAWSFWVTVRMGFPALAGLWGKIGADPDPDGYLLGSVSQKLGPGMDPDGKPLSVPVAPLPQESSGNSDPNG